MDDPERNPGGDPPEVPPRNPDDEVSHIASVVVDTTGQRDVRDEVSWQ